MKSDALTAPTVRPAGSAPQAGTTLLPDHFLRRWDPVTVFFPRDTGPAGGGPEDHPERYVSMSPGHPGAYTWLDARTLQFQPAEAWPPLSRFVVRAGGSELTRVTLMAAPVATMPSSGEEGLEPVEAIGLTFPEPMEQGDLARMVTIELRPLPGMPAAGARRTRWLDKSDFRVKTLERATRADAASYVLHLNQPIPVGMRAIVRLRLSLDDDAEKSFAELSFATAEPFRIVSAGPPTMQVLVTPEGSRYPRDRAINGGRKEGACWCAFRSRRGRWAPSRSATWSASRRRWTTSSSTCPTRRSPRPARCWQSRRSCWGSNVPGSSIERKRSSRK